ncbi:ATP-binding protein [Nitratidesulfovibrio vulgaris]|jgi:serine/threonine-protein kinase RsbW|nr:ATP-binding protein [Nitratidesulfovibrio vulgaris]ADP86992.1 ATP-binding region ATPase domain protein [Nitratidesulfovibrio vulgaris RCH1]
MMRVCAFKAPATLESYRPLVCQVLEVLSPWLCDCDTLKTLEIILGEACANVIRHAYPGGAEGDMLVEVDVQPRTSVTIHVTDWGVGPVGGKQPPHFGESGHGLRIIGKLSEDCVLERRDGKTVLRATIHIPEAAWQPSTCNTTATSS